MSKALDSILDCTEARNTYMKHILNSMIQFSIDTSLYLNNKVNKQK